MHQTVEQALALIERLETCAKHGSRTSRTISRTPKLMNAFANWELKNVALAYDGLQFEVVRRCTAETSRSRAFSGVGEARSTQVAAFESPEAWSAHYAPDEARQRARHRQLRRHPPRTSGDPARSGCERPTTAAVATALTFDPSPRRVLQPESAPSRLSTNAQRMDWFGVVGLEAAVVMPFTLDLARLSPEDFVDQILVRDLQVRVVLVGENFHFGHRQAGDVKLLRELGMRIGFDVVVIPPVFYRGEIVSST